MGRKKRRYKPTPTLDSIVDDILTRHENARREENRRKLLEKAEEPQEYEEPLEPDEGDYVCSSTGCLGCKTLVSVAGERRIIGTFVEWWEIEDAIRADAKKHQFWPNVWQLSDHGNFHLCTSWKWKDDDAKEPTA